MVRQSLKLILPSEAASKWLSGTMYSRRLKGLHVLMFTFYSNNSQPLSCRSYVHKTRLRCSQDAVKEPFCHEPRSRLVKTMKNLSSHLSLLQSLPVPGSSHQSQRSPRMLFRTWSEPPAWFRTKLFVASDASIALSFSDVSDAHQFFTSPLRSSNNLDYRANPPHGRNTDIGCR